MEGQDMVRNVRKELSIGMYRYKY